ncbi:SRPBCC family protein [Vibrio coralliilyticus]|uniref:SRPBCC family protein n=1 Tax=Vibrio coralliilyticus TaxID=190893 RepID=UPI00155F72CC|nr:SRPBCC family protein [Vibrio coralliilyticus]NRF13559.1 SRPBCC family protein [Vibrio coralliilyticus]
MKKMNSIKPLGNIALVAGAVLLGACSTIAPEGSAPQYTSQYDHTSTTVNEFDIRSVTSAPEQIVLMFRVNSSPDRTFELVSEIDQLATWFTGIKNPEMDNSKSLNGPLAMGTHSVRSCSLDDEILYEDIVYYDKNKRSYAYTIDMERSTVSFPITEPLSLFTVEPDGLGGSLVTWRHYFHKNVSLVAPVLNLIMEGMILEPAVENLFERVGGEWVEPTTV